jgi:ankyrin repeat protein
LFFGEQLEDKKGMTALHLACKHGHDELALLLIDKTDAEKLCSKSAETLPLHVAARNKNEKYELVKRMLEKIRKASAEESRSKLLSVALRKEDTGRQPLLHIAVENGHINIVELLLRDYGVDKEQRDSKHGNLPIHVAARTGSVEMLQVLQKHDAFSFKQNNNMETALHVAAANNRIRFIRKFMRHEKHLMRRAREQEDDYEHEYVGGAGAGDEDEHSLVCMCRCDIGVDHVPSVLVCNKQMYTPLMSAVAAGNQRCVEELLQAASGDGSGDLTASALVNVRDKDGNSIYHICAERNNIDSLSYLLEKNILNKEMLMSKNSAYENVLHVACKSGNMEIVKLIMSACTAASDEPTSLSSDALLFGKSKEGYIPFHLACTKGYYNIAEYFLKEAKSSALVDSGDNAANTGLHLATLNGQSSIVSLLLDNGADVNAKNEDNNTALELSCRKGYFEISKILINRYSMIGGGDRSTNFDYPLHVACYEGAHEVVKLLLLKGAAIDRLNDENQNCLDIAISRGHREVIRVLLSDANCHKLIRTSNRDETRRKSRKSVAKPGAKAAEDDSTINVITTSSMGDSAMFQHSFVEQQQQQQQRRRQTMAKEDKYLENPQLVALFENKMWDMFKLVLDKCIGEKETDFSKLDPPVKSISRHPLMLIARSGQENLLKHDATQMLLQLKWRFIPRFAFYFNLLFYVTFLVLFSMYSIELADLGHSHGYYPKHWKTNQNRSLMHLPQPQKQLLGQPQQQQQSTFGGAGNRFTQNASMHSPLLYALLSAMFLFNVLKQLFQLLLIDGVSYFTSLQNLVEIFTYTSGMISLLSTDYSTRAAYGSLAILSAFIVFPLFIQKLKMFGLYVVAFCRTLANSAKFFPIFLLIFIGFILSFRVRANFGVTYSNSTAYSILRTLTMVSGEFETAKMGLTSDSLTNYIVYFLFIGLMCTILLNLFVGIAVGEIKTVLDEADIQQTSMRIIFVLKVQSVIAAISEKIDLMKPVLGVMLFSKYSYANESQLIKFVDSVRERLHRLLLSNRHTIKLSDKQQRLEDAVEEMAKNTGDEIRSVKIIFNHQLNELETRVTNGQRRVEDSLIEVSRKTHTQIDVLREEAQMAIKSAMLALATAQTSFENACAKMTQRVLDEFAYVSTTVEMKLGGVESRLSDTEQKLHDTMAVFAQTLRQELSASGERLDRRMSENKTVMLGLHEQLEMSLRQELMNANGELSAIREASMQASDHLGAIQAQIVSIEEAWNKAQTK